MIVVKDYAISMTRGDTFKCYIKPMIDDDTEYTFSEGDTMRFAMKESYSSEEVLLNIDIPTDTRLLHIKPEDTKSLAFSSYVYDIQLTYANGDVDTFIIGTVKLTEEVD